MNKTVNVNLAGQHFYFDQAAKTKLEIYFDEIKKHFTDEVLCQEIMTDVEARIAELLQQKTTHPQQVITIKNIEDIIEVMGEPNAYKIDEEEDKTEKTKQKKSLRKLFRDPDDRFFGGVASGVAHYFGLQIKWVRLIWLLLALFSWGGFTILYIALWVFVPLAKTTTEKFMMKGEAVNLSNIEKKIKEEFQNVTENIKNADYKKAKRKMKSKTSIFFHQLADFIMLMFRFALKIVGVVCVITASVALMIILVFMFSIGMHEVFDVALGAPYWPPIDIMHMGISIWNAVLLVLLLIAIPMIYIFILGRWLITSQFIGSIGTHLLFLGVWFFSILLFAALGFRFMNGFINLH